MKKETLKNIINFLEKEENKIPMDKGDLRWMIVFNEPISDEDLHIQGNLDLFGLKVESLPEGLYVGGDLDLENSKITSLPEGLYVGGDLNLKKCHELKSLPKGLKVEGDVIITESNLVNYTEYELKKMIQPGYIKGEVLEYEDPIDDDDEF